MTPTGSEPAYPKLKESADAASRRAQKIFLRLNIGQFILLAAVALVAGANFAAPSYQRNASWCIAGLMFIALGVSTMLKVGKFDDRWFRCRAYAENFKSSVWRYVMCGENAESAELQYVQDLAAIRERLPDLDSEFALFDISGPLITEWMHSVKALTVSEKVAAYRKLRIEDQIQWYSNKAKANASAENTWLWAIIGTEFVAVLVAVIQAVEQLKVNATGGIAAIGTAFVAWTQIKRFSDLDTSYSIAAQDLQLLAAATHPDLNQEALDRLVRNVEKAVSREHSMWLSRRVRTSERS